MIPVLYNLSQKIETERVLANSFTEASITLIKKPERQSGMMSLPNLKTHHMKTLQEKEIVDQYLSKT